MVSNQARKLNSVIKSLVVEKDKACEIYIRMCNMYKEACFSSKNIYK